MAKFRSAWWSAEIPDGWTAEHDESCATFVGAQGALQISAARKDSDDVTDDDIAEYATHTYGSNVALTPVS